MKKNLVRILAFVLAGIMLLSLVKYLLLHARLLREQDAAS